MNGSWLRWSPYGVTVLAFALGLWQKWPCHAAGWPYQRELIFGQGCYSDLPVLFTDRGLSDGHFPYATERSFEYPVLLGYVADLTARLVSTKPSYFLLNVAFLLICALVVVWATVKLTGRIEAGLIVAASPALVLAGTINWDLLPVALVSLALLAWARDRPAWAGVAIGLGTAAKLYPALLLLPLFLLALRNSRWRPALTAAGAAAVTWLVVNLPVLLAYPAGWAEFWRLNADRGADFGSIYYALQLLGEPIQPLNTTAIVLLAGGFAAITAYALLVKRTPPVEVLALLTVLAFLMTSKVYSPQYVLWLLPLAVVARVRLSVIVIWQLAEVGYWYAIWSHLAGTISHQSYAYLTFGRIAGQLLLAASLVMVPRRSNPY